MKRKLTITIITIAAAVLILAGCTPPQRRGARNPAEAQTPVEQSFNIKTAVVERSDISSKLMLSGDVEASASVDVYPETGGKLSVLYIETGSWVSKGQVIAKVDPSKPGRNYAESPVEAPISGTVTAINSDPGATVNAQMPLVTIGDISSLVITTNVPERYIYMVEKGQTAWVTTTASPGKEYEARVSSIAPVVNPTSRTLQIKLNIIGNTPIKAGMFVGIELRTSTSKDSLIIPEKAILSRDEETFVYRVTGNRVEKTFVSTGIKDSGWVEITEGLSEDELVATEGVSLLSDGAMIRILSNGDGR